MKDIINLLTFNNIHHHYNQNILVCNLADMKKATFLVKEILVKVTNSKTMIFLSGGKTPKELYGEIAIDETFHPGIVGLVDERFGERLHKKSNEKMIEDTGFLKSLRLRGIPFYPILKDGLSRKDTALKYDEELRSLFAVYPKSIGILGLGSDGHTAGLSAQNSKLKTQKSKVDEEFPLVTEYNDTTGKYGERVTMTFLGLSMLDLLIVLVMGNDKKDALNLCFTEGLEEEIPARFFKRPEIARKTILITDQNV